ncbi:type IV pilus biogenesis/stability protein PilW [Variovorax sp. J22R133]|uniref:type IV pilus biogenesis/stability protein PilW n=1 Tax=Variovorax brevis TaxID=3053503 RepID=UPI0025763A4C|nr:type IV pilus biogenesis/stability protein PilW [Variovorax sp. J22R133]MDM0112170.1 type IV pilus biogenesis/stability protein PilW [Variovorax sp. J22R133]
MSMAFPIPWVAASRLALGIFAAILLAGCANKSSGSGPVLNSGRGAEPEIVTESDETSGRKRARLRLELAMGYYEQGQTTVALDEIKQALTADPNYSDAYNLRGLIYMRLDDPPMAEDSFRRAISLNPRDANAMHNYGWLLCQQQRYADATRQFNRALDVPNYTDRAKTLLTEGVCQIRAGEMAEAERTLTKAYEIDAANPVIGYNLAMILTRRDEWTRAQFYIRRVNNSQAANAETLWLGIKVERHLNNRDAVTQLAGQLQRRFPQSKEAQAYERGNFND